MWFLYSKEKLKVKFLLLKINNQSQLKWQLSLETVISCHWKRKENAEI